MRLKREDIGSIVILTPCEARLDMSRAAAFRDEARTHIQTTTEKCIVDLSMVTFVDSSGIGALVGLMKFLGRERRLELCSLAPAVQKVFKITRLDTVFIIHPDLDSALDNVGRHSSAG